MLHNILITGASGYLGGTILARWDKANLPSYQTLYALVRTDEQAAAVKKYGAKPIFFDIKDEASVRTAIVENEISVVYFLVDAMSSVSQLPMIKALAEVRKKTGKDVHFLHTSGAKIFSSHAGLPIDQPILDNDSGLYGLQKSAIAKFDLVQTAVATNNTVIDTSEAYGVKSYIFVPCVVYGEGGGFGNPISIQTVAIVKAAKALGRVYRLDSEDFSWPVSHITDTTNLYLEILRAILSGREIGYGRNGYYLASSGSVAWNDIYRAMAKALAQRNVIDTDTVDLVEDTAQDEMGKALGCPKDMVPLFLGGNCTLEAQHGREIGWVPQHPPEHILDMADAEVELILKHLK